MVKSASNSSSSSSSVDSNEDVENSSFSSSRKSRSKSINSSSSSASSNRNHSPEWQPISKEPQSPVHDYEQHSQDSQSPSASNHSDVSSDGTANESRRDDPLSERDNQPFLRDQSVSPTRGNHSRNSITPTNNGQLKNDAINISHEDLSDVSDLESATPSPENENDDTENKSTPIIDLRQKINEKKNQQNVTDDKHNDQGNKQSPSIVDELNDIMDQKHDEDALDFEAEDGECPDEKEEKPTETEKPEHKLKKDSDGEIEEGEELEEGEVSDEDEKRPEETEPKPVCRFYTRGQCTWGMSCRFLHPGVTDKGNYTMFDMIRPVPVNTHAPPQYGPGGIVPSYHHDFRAERPAINPMHMGNGPAQVRPIAEPIVESAWERGLRTAKEMMRKANKRKEQDMDFEDKKMNLSASQDELEKDNYYIRERSPEISPPTGYVRPPIGMHHPSIKGGYSPPHKYGMPPRPAPIPYEEDPYGRSLRYRELPPHRMPQYEDEIMTGKRRIRPAREVIVQRAEPVGRGDEWNDPWMRSKSPGRDREKRQKRERRSYSTHSSYSSSSNSSSQSASSSNSTRSPSPTTRRRQYSITRTSGHKSPVRGRHAKRSQSLELHKRRHSPAIRRSPPSNKKRQATPPSIEKRVTRSPINKRKRVSPAPPPPRKPISFSIATTNNLRKKKRSSSSGSGSSDSSASDSGSSDSSSSSESSSRNGHKSRARDKVTSERKLASKKIEAAAKKRSPPAQSGSGKGSADISTNNTSKSNSSSSANAKKSTRREELLKQLRAVEDAIARKRSKLS